MRQEIKIFIFLLLLSSCKKEGNINPENKPTQVTYKFYSESVPYHIQIWDITNLNDFQDSVYTKSFEKTVSYTYNAFLRTSIEANSPSLKQITITHTGGTNTCSDTLYSSLECGIQL